MNGVMKGKVRVGVSERHTWHLLAAYRRGWSCCRGSREQREEAYEQD